MLPSLRLILTGTCVAALLLTAAIPGLVSREVGAQGLGPSARPQIQPTIADNPDAPHFGLMAYARRAEELQRLADHPFDGESILHVGVNPAEIVALRFGTLPSQAPPNIDMTSTEQGTAETSMTVVTPTVAAPTVAVSAAIALTDASLSAVATTEVSTAAVDSSVARTVDAAAHTSQPDAPTVVAALSTYDETTAAPELTEIVEDARPIAGPVPLPRSAPGLQRAKKSAGAIKKPARVAKLAVPKKAKRAVSVRKRAVGQAIAASPFGTFTPDSQTQR